MCVSLLLWVIGLGGRQPLTALLHLPPHPHRALPIPPLPGEGRGPGRGSVFLGVGGSVGGSLCYGELLPVYLLVLRL